MLITEISKPGWIGGCRKTSSFMNISIVHVDIQEVLLNALYKSGC